MQIHESFKVSFLMSWASPDIGSVSSSPGSKLHFCHVSLADGAYRWFLSDNVVLSEHQQCSVFSLTPIPVHPVTHKIWHFYQYCWVMVKPCPQHIWKLQLLICWSEIFMKTKNHKCLDLMYLNISSYKKRINKILCSYQDKNLVATGNQRISLVVFNYYVVSIINKWLWDYMLILPAIYM